MSHLTCDAWLRDLQRIDVSIDLKFAADTGTHIIAKPQEDAEGIGLLDDGVYRFGDNSGHGWEFGWLLA